MLSSLAHKVEINRITVQAWSDDRPVREVTCLATKVSTLEPSSSGIRKTYRPSRQPESLLQQQTPLREPLRANIRWSRTRTQSCCGPTVRSRDSVGFRRSTRWFVELRDIGLTRQNSFAIKCSSDGACLLPPCFREFRLQADPCVVIHIDPQPQTSRAFKLGSIRPSDLPTQSRSTRPFWSSSLKSPRPRPLVKKT